MEIKNIKIEEPIENSDLNVMGLIDILIEYDDGSIYIYDIKTIGTWSWNYKFKPKYKDKAEPSLHHELQLATYGLGVEKEYGRLDGMFILYYNKDTSMLRYKEVSRDRLLTALGFWERINAEHSRNSLPSPQNDVSPVASWECNYCAFKTRCNQDKEKGL